MVRRGLIPFLFILFGLVACVPPPTTTTSSYGVDEWEAAATRTAFESANAAATVSAYYAGQTAAAQQYLDTQASATAMADQGTRAAVQATSQHLADRATEAAVSGYATRQASQLAAEAIIAEAAAGGTAAAIHNLTVLENQQVAAEQTRTAIDIQERAAEASRAKAAGYFRVAWPWLFALFVLLVAAAVFVIIWRRGKPQIIDNGPGRPPMIIVQTSDGLRPLLPGPRESAVLQLPAETQTRPEEAAAPMGKVVELPAGLRPHELGLGVTPTRQLWFDQAKLGDILGAGQKGSGKSTMVRSLAYQARMQGWGLYLADAELLTFDPAVWGHVASSPAEVEAMLDAILAEFDRRFELYREAFAQVRQLPAAQQFFVEDLAGYNQAAGLFGLERLKPMLLAWDEANNHLGASAALDDALHEVLRRNRKPGCTVAIFGHTWHASQVKSSIFTNLTRRLAFRCSERTSRVVLGDPTAAELPANVPGLAVMLAGRGKLGQFQGYYLPPARILNDVRPDPGEPGLPPPLIIGRPIIKLPEEPQEDPEAARIRALRAAGKSQRAIEEEVFGYTGGEAYKRVKAVLDATATAENSQFAAAL